MNKLYRLKELEWTEDHSYNGGVMHKAEMAYATYFIFEYAAGDPERSFIDLEEIGAGDQDTNLTHCVSVEEAKELADAKWLARGTVDLEPRCSRRDESSEEPRPVPCPFCKEHWQCYNDKWRHVGDCMICSDFFFLERGMEVDNYNEDIARMRSGVASEVLTEVLGLMSRTLAQVQTRIQIRAIAGEGSGDWDEALDLNKQLRQKIRDMLPKEDDE